MRKFCLYISLVTNSGCLTSKQSTPTNEWVVLNSAKEIKCEVWPMAEKDLEVTNIIPVTGKGGNIGAIGVIRQRNSSIQNVFIPLNSSFELDTDLAMVIPIAQSSNVLGAWHTDAGPIALVSNKLGERSTFELRNKISVCY
jgi:LytS/YehU family sensor histidine kinase